ncbi:cysteine hydrolase [Thermoflavimicrobium daqui]|uniref:Cysteine hydrolase n=1 Tax=Thermoflavimicrobium daqui TaxID=2137476 RepID=A0A364K6R9_9BACL|nr:cysteine hydrolase [Thermoflavimicrobium daqui]
MSSRLGEKSLLERSIDKIGGLTLETRASFFEYMDNLSKELPKVHVEELIQQVNHIDHVYLVLVDIIKGFCETGALSSEKVNEMVEPVWNLAQSLLKKGIPHQNVVFLNDAHPKDAVEFSAFAPHCVRGTGEEEVVATLKPLQDLPGVQTFSKNATTGLFGINQQGQAFHSWLEEVFTKRDSLFIVVGDCTDLCIYQNAMGIRLLANERNAQTQVVVSKEHVRTYDVSVKQAKQLNILAHPHEVIDQFFLYHMKLNGIQVVSSIET